MDRTLYVTGVESQLNLKSRIKDLFLKSTHNLEWLQPGELVLIKPALNSAHPYPSTTHPMAVEVISELLQERGADVVVGDQSGIRSVLHHPDGVVHGRSQDNYINSGMGGFNQPNNNINFIGFEDEDWNQGFYKYQSRRTSSWPNGFYVTRWIKKSDHIINLPRISTHTQAGATLGFKNMIGIIRDDSRMDYHANGPYNYLIRFNTWKSSLKSLDDYSGKFFEKIVEISDAVKDKLRLTMFTATKAQTTFGPDGFILNLGKLKFGKAHISNLNPGLLIASQDPVASETCALAILKILRKTLPISSKIYERIVLFSSYNTGNIDGIHIKDHPYIKHAIKMGIGNFPSQIQFDNVPQFMRYKINDLLDLRRDI
jgi:uncharacterized protein (DUF362 family)